MSKSTYCSRCKHYCLAVWQYPNILTHGMLCAFTCGLWFPIFLLFFNGRYVCRDCGGKV